MVISPQEIYAYLRSLGVSEASAAAIIVNIKFESTFNSSAVGDKNLATPSYGLFQWRESRYTNLVNYAASRGTDWTDWRTQIDFALIEARQMGINLQQTDAVAASKEWTIKFERPSNAAAKAETRAAEVHNYEYGDPATLAHSGNAAASESAETLNLPSGGSWFKVGNDYYIAYRFYGNSDKTGPSQVVYFLATMPPPPGEYIHSESDWNKWHNNWTDGGTTDSFRGTPPNKSYQDLVNDLLLELGLMGTDAMQDPGVMAIIAIAMTRRMSEAELRNRLRQTDWWNSRTDKEREWNDLSDAEKNLRIVDHAMAMVGLWFTYVGTDLNVAQYDTNNDGVVSAEELRNGNLELYEWALKIASGEVSEAQAVNVWMKAVALEDENSPWSRIVRDEEIAKGQHGSDVSNMSGRIQDLYYDWGVPITEARALELAEQVILNKISFEEVEDELTEQANGLYPHKPPNMPTREWAQPYMQMYMQTLELAEVDLDNKDIAAALASGENLADFKSKLRHDARWLETDNAKNEMNTKISSLGRVMGF